MTQLVVVQDGFAFATLGPGQAPVWEDLYPWGEVLVEITDDINPLEQPLDLPALLATGGTVKATRSGEGTLPAALMLRQCRAIVADDRLRRQAGAAPLLTPALRSALRASAASAYQRLEDPLAPLVSLPAVLEDLDVQ